MEISCSKNETSLTIALSGRLDTTTAPDFEAVIKAELDGISELILDFGGLEYISSAGLRTLLVAQKKMSAQGGSLIVRGCNESIREVFEITGFSDILTIE